MQFCGTMVLFILVLSFGIYFFIKFLRDNKKEEGFASVFIATGVELVVTSFGSNFDKFMQFWVILQNNASVKDFLTMANQSSNVNVPQMIAGILIVGVGIWFIKHVKERMYILNINGYFDKRIEEHYKELGLDKFEFKEREIDLFQYLKADINETRVEEMVKLIKRKVDAFRNESKEVKRGFTGIAPIPFIMLAGTYLKRISFDDYFEFDKVETESYVKLEEGKNYPELKDMTDYSKVNSNVEDVVISVSTTVSIQKEQLKQFKNCEFIMLSVPNPKDLTIRYINQLKEYKNAVIETINRLPEHFPNLKRIHLTCATQSCLVLEIGKNLEHYRNYQVICYHFDAQKEKKYPWGIVMNGSQQGKLVKA